MPVSHSCDGRRGELRSTVRGFGPKAARRGQFWNAAGGHTYYDVMPDGKLVMLEAEGAREGAYVNVVVNWFEELEARVPR